jgi:membrane-associated phospholipid phosphatase
MNSIRAARAISIAGHPFVLIPLAVALAAGSFITAAIVAATTALPIYLITRRRVRRGEWSDYDVSRHDQRSSLYWMSFPLMGVAAVALHLSGAGPRMMHGVLAGAAMLAAGMLGNRWLKISMHMMFATFAAVIVARSSPRLLPIAIAVVLLVGWSRLHLKRHTLAEVLVGTAIGLAAGLYAVA